jgi:hypothetical protein
MKNKLFQFLSLTVLVVFPMALSAQILGGDDMDYSKRISFGPKVGANVSNIYDTQGDEFEADSKLGFAGGVFVTLPLTRFIGLQPEILFSQKGYRGSGSILGSEYSFSRTTNYIDVPLLLAVRTCKFLTILVGPQYSFLLSQNYTFKSDLINISQDEQFENENLLKNTLCLTAGLDVNLGRMVIGARGGWDVLSNKGDGTSSTPRYKNMWYQATVGYRF